MNDTPYPHPEQTYPSEDGIYPNDPEPGPETETQKE